MKRRKIYLIGGSVLCFLFIAAGLVWANPFEKKDGQVYQISYIFRGAVLEESRQAVKQGLEQASNDYKVEISTVYARNPLDPREQAELIQKEAKNGADAILIEPLDDEIVAEAMEQAGVKIPVVEMNAQVQGLQGQKFQSVYCENEQLGRALGKAIAKGTGTGESVVMIRYGTRYSDTKEQYEGAKHFLEEQGIEMINLELSGDERQREMTLRALMRNQSTTQLAIFDSGSLELSGKIKKDSEEFSEVGIYGVGRTNQIIAYLEEGIIQTIGVMNEYSMGYMGVCKAVNQIRGIENEQEEIEYAIVNLSTLYTTENQRLLFPFVQ